jgi:hypothetical protein
MDFNTHNLLMVQFICRQIVIGQTQQGILMYFTMAKSDHIFTLNVEILMYGCLNKE